MKASPPRAEMGDPQPGFPRINISTEISAIAEVQSPTRPIAARRTITGLILGGSIATIWRTKVGRCKAYDNTGS
jgi:hypothetical protein